MILAGVFLLGAAVSWAIARGLIKYSYFLHLIDVPNARSSHAKPTPKGGGLAIVAGTLVVLILLCFLGFLHFKNQLFILIIGSLSMAVLGFASDRWNIGEKARFIAQIIISLGVVLMVGNYSNIELFGTRLPLGAFGIIFFTFWLAGVANFYNFMDGIDGLAASQGIVAGCAFLLFGIVAGDIRLISLGAAIAAGCLGFAFFNMPPARIFMGDVGSYFIGFYIAGSVFLGDRLFVPVVLVLGVFLFDTIVTLAGRILKKEVWYKAHCNHFYQRAVRSGLGHGTVTGALIPVFLVLMVMGVVYLSGSLFFMLIAVSISLVCLLGLVLLVKIREANKIA